MEEITVPIMTILNSMGGLALLSLGWAWRLQQKITRLETIQSMNGDHLTKIQETVTITARKIAKIEGMLDERLRK